MEIINVASGYKQIGLLQLLLSNHSVSEGVPSGIYCYNSNGFVTGIM